MTGTEREKGSLSGTWQWKENLEKISHPELHKVFSYREMKMLSKMKKSKYVTTNSV